MSRTDSQGRRLCTAHTTRGTACRAPAITGATVCRSHGGSAPQVKKKAHEVVLNDLIGPAILKLSDLMNDPDVPAAVQLRAAAEILDRSGYEEGYVVTGADIDRLIAELEAEEAARKAHIAANREANKRT